MIYEPKGKAREYSPLALNLYEGCGHGCAYCYVPNVIKVTRQEFDNNVKVKKEFIDRLSKSAKKHFGSDKQVLMSFTTDPYNMLNEKMNLTREALKILLQNRIPVTILSKAGTKVLNDLDIIRKFGKHIKVGASLTFTENPDSLKWERNAALPADRIEALKQFHQLGIKTWASLEPVIEPEQSLKLIDITHSFVDEFQVGRLNHVNKKIELKEFLNKAVEKLVGYKKEFYIKEELRLADPDLKLDSKYTEMDYLTLPGFPDMMPDDSFFNR